LKLNYNKLDAEDCTQETFVTLYNYLSKIKNLDYVATWLYKTANNYINRKIRQYSKDNRYLTYPDQSEKDGIENLVYEENFDLIFEDKIYIEKYVQIILEQLSEKELILWYLYFKEEKSLIDICSVLKISQNSAYVRIHRLKAKISQIIKELLSNEEIDIHCTKL
jgi:RNA polymerase sigma-70 factor (ECF subfamily)